MTNFEQDKISTIICEELKKSDVLDIAKKDRDFERRIKEIVADVVIDLFRSLWQHNGFVKGLVK